MTTKEAIAAVDLLKPNQYDSATKLSWLTRLDGKIFNELILTHAHEEESLPDYDADTELLVPEPYGGDIYNWYLQSMIDLHNGESAKYNQSAAQFNTAYSEYACRYHRTHDPLPEASRFLF